MHTGKYVFAQLVEFLPQKTFQRIVMKYQGDKYIKSFSCWNQLLIMMYGQLSGCESLRELVCIITAHAPKSYHLGFGKSVITRSNLSKANANRDSKIFEEFAYKMISIAQRKRIAKEFEIAGRFYAFDSTTIDLCLNLFWWARFRKAKGGIKIHTLYDVVTQIPAFIHITEAKVHDMNAMDEIPYEANAYYIFDRGYFDLARLFTINCIGSNLKSLREKIFLKALITFSTTRRYGLRDSRQGENILFCSGVSAITLWNIKEPSLTLPIILKSAQDILRCFIKTDGKWNCFLSG
jgi:hypothetical protein